MRILIVEDDPSVLRATSYILEKEGYEVLTAMKGLEGLRRAKEDNPDLLILDVMLPGIDGFEICYRLRTESKTAQFYKGAGCDLCGGTVYLGQCGVFELLALTEEVKQLFISGATAAQIRTQAVKDGMEPLKHDAMLKVREGITTISEVLRSVYSTNY